MIRVLHIIDHQGLGGAQSLIQNMIQYRQSTYLMPLKGKRSEQIKLPKEKYFLPPSHSVFHFLLKIIQAPSLVLRNKINIVHCHLAASWIFGLWLHFWLRNNENVQFVFHEHDSGRINHWYYPLLLNLVQRTGKIIVVSVHTKNNIIARGADDRKIYLLRNFIDLEHFTPPSEPNAKLSLDPAWVEDSHIIGFAGRITKAKGWQYILEVALLLRDKKVKFLIAGTGSDEKKLRQAIISQRLEHQVKLMGHLQNMPEFYHTIEILVFPSSQESFGLVQIEAQACGVPVIAFSIEASQELVATNSAVLVQPGDTKGLAEAISRILENPEYYQTLVQNGLKNAQQYSMKEYLKKLDALYIRLSAGKESR